jgi:hypothetical protein
MNCHHEPSSEEGFSYCLNCGCILLTEERTVSAGTASGHSVDIDAPVLVECTPEGVARALNEVPFLLDFLRSGWGDEQVDNHKVFGRLVDAIKEVTF